MSNYQGIVLSSKNYKENDKLVTCLVKELGKMNLIIENPNSQSTNYALSEPLCLIEFSARKVTNTDCLYYLYQGNQTDAYKGIRSSQLKLAYVVYFLNLVASLIDYCEIDERVYDFTEQYLMLANIVDESSIDLYTTAMSLRLLTILGLGAIPKWCFNCDKEHQSLIYITEKGLSICKYCIVNEKHVKISKDRWNKLAEEELVQLKNFDIERDEIFAIEFYIKGIVGKEIKGYKYLKLIR